jgi:hypothetical protein
MAKRQMRILMWQKRNKVVPVNVFFDQEDELMRAAHKINNAKRMEDARINLEIKNNVLIKQSH